MITASDGSLSGSASRSISVAAVNDAPVVTTGGTLAYTENGAATAVHSTTVPSQDTITAPPAWRAISPVSRVTVWLPYWKDLLIFATVWNP